MSELSIRRAGLTVLAFTLLTRLSGFAREIVIAGAYGTSEAVDIYLASITIPANIMTILHQALPNAFVPLFAGPGESDRRSRSVAWAVLGAMTLLTGVLWVFAAAIASATNTGFSAPLRVETVTLVRIVSGAVLLATIEALTRSRLVARRQFVRSGISSLWLNLAIITAVIWFADGGARTLAWGFLIGTLCTALWNLAVGWGRKPAVHPQDDYDANHRHSAGGWVTTVLLINVTGLVYALIDRHFASFLAEGSIAALQYADIIASQPLSVVAVALGIAIFPYLAERFKTRDHDGVSTIVNQAVRWSLVAAVPAAVALAILGRPIITILLERGQFDALSRSTTAGVLVVYAGWVVPAVVAAVIVKVFYASLRWRPILLGVILSLLAKAGLSLWWVQTLGIRGLAAASAVAALVYVVVLLSFLPRWSVGDSWIGWVRVALATGLLTSLACLLGQSASLLLPHLTWQQTAILIVSVAAVTGAGLLLGLGPRLGISEMTEIRTALRAFILHRR